MLSLTFGDSRRHAEALETIRAIHRRVNGQLATSVGRFPAGTRYSAEDPDLVLWVHATLLDSLPLIYERVVRPLTDDERNSYCTETAGVAVELGARPADVPHSWAELRAYLEAMYASGVIVVGTQARELASAVLAPPLAAFVGPIAWVNRVVSVGLLPADVRREYGFEWGAPDDRRLHRALRVVRSIRAVLPNRVAWWPQARA
jgi:uncharacterized protein (DUF2236 family)